MIDYGDIVHFPVILPVGVETNEIKNKILVVFINYLLDDYGAMVAK